MSCNAIKEISVFLENFFSGNLNIPQSNSKMLCYTLALFLDFISKNKCIKINIEENIAFPFVLYSLVQITIVKILNYSI